MFYAKKTGPSGESQQVLVNAAQTYQPEEVFTKIDELAKERKFDESVEAIVKLNVDPTKGDQMIRGTCILPSGTGKEIKVCVFADGEFHSELKEAGADILGNDQVLIDIGNGNVPFDKIICTQEHIQDLKKFARILGPKGLMPNTKSGTLVKADEIVEQVR